MFVLQFVVLVDMGVQILLLLEVLVVAVEGLHM
jgi:hypothetical protein